MPEFKKSSTVVMSPGLIDNEEEENSWRKASKSNTHVVGIWKNKDQVPSERQSSDSVSKSVNIKSGLSGSVSKKSPKS